MGKTSFLKIKEVTITIPIKPAAIENQNDLLVLYHDENLTVIDLGDKLGIDVILEGLRLNCNLNFCVGRVAVK